ncbi:MAG TPA: hypothetical protein VJJ54_02485 [Gemmatimonadales bacterium]|nr:hypothetical protein [Gemmatimonadales bacterium]
MRAVTFPCPGSPADAVARLEAAIDARRWNAPGMDGWIRAGGAVLYYRDAAKYRALFRRTFVGQVRERAGATVLEGRFGMTWLARLLLPVWLAPAAVCIGLALAHTRLQPQSPAPKLVLLLLGALLGVLAFGRFGLEWWGRPGDRDAITQAIRAALQARDGV